MVMVDKALYTPLPSQGSTILRRVFASRRVPVDCCAGPIGDDGSIPRCSGLFHGVYRGKVILGLSWR